MSGGREADVEVRKAYLLAMKPAQRPEAWDIPRALQFKLLRCNAPICTTAVFADRNTLQLFEP